LGFGGLKDPCPVKPVCICVRSDYISYRSAASERRLYAVEG